MKTRNYFSLFFKYISRHITAIAAFFIFFLTFAVIFFLYDIESESLFYASFLCILTGTALFVFSFLRYCAKHKKLEQISKNIELLIEELPSPSNQIEEDYQEMINNLVNLNRSSATAVISTRREITDYFTLWAHQIKVPISAMRLILDEEDIPRNRELAAELFKIEQYADLALCYLRLDSPSSDFVFREYDIDSIIRQAIRKYAGMFVRKRIKLIYKPTRLKTVTDEKWLCFVIEQLLSNAVKYTKNGFVTISVDEKNVLSVSDTGIGIAAEDLPRIFERGFTGYNGREDKKATGLGLYLCSQACEKLSHKISVTSEPGKGTTVYIDLNRPNFKIE